MEDYGAMSSFFEPPPPPEPEPQRPPQPWHGASDAVIGRTVALDLVLGRSGKAALWIPAVTVYADGFEFDIELRHRLDEEEFGHPFFMHPHHPRRRRPPEAGLDPGILRFGIEFSDGRKATNLDTRMPFPLPGEPDTPPHGPVLVPARGGGGGDGRWHFGFWLWPLPPDGPLAFVCEWPVADIAETRQEIDSAPIRGAAADTSVLWPEDERRSSSGGMSYQTVRATTAPPPPTTAPPPPKPTEPADPDTAA